MLEPIIANGNLMTDANRKPWLMASEQIDHLKSRGVHFSLMSEDDARAYLERTATIFVWVLIDLGFLKLRREIARESMQI